MSPRRNPWAAPSPYQGRLNDGPNPANGRYDLKFTLYDAVTAGSALGTSLTTNAVAVSNGFFTVTLDFGAGVFTGDARWLDIAVKTNGGGVFTTLTPRQPLMPAPYAHYAPSAGNAVLLNGQSSTAYAPATGSPAYVARAGDTITGTLTVAADGLRAGANQLVLSGNNVGIGTTTPAAKLDVNGMGRMWGVDMPSTWGSVAMNATWDSGISNWRRIGDGYASMVQQSGSEGGLNWHVAGTGSAGETVNWRMPFQLTKEGDVVIDWVGANTNGTLSGELRFGWSGSGEGIASKRGSSGGGNQWGLDFYTASQPRLSIANNGNVGIGTGTPGTKLHVAGAVAIGNTSDPSPPAGTIRWTGSDFEGYNGTNWLSLTGRGNPPTNTVLPYANMVWIPPGTFTMGSPDTEVDRNPIEGPQTTVTLTRGFYMSKYEVTQGEYLAAMSSNPSHFTAANGRGDDLSRPVEMVSWNDAVVYCLFLTQRERDAGRIPGNYQYRLPTEAEWEYACRAGTTNRLSYGDDLGPPAYALLGNYAWYNNNSGSTTHSVGQRLHNPWGLDDMYGNVFEWCQDWFGTYPGGSVTDPQGPVTGLFRVLRGGSWLDYARYCRSAYRYNFVYPTFRHAEIGFRVVLAPGQP